MNTIKIIFILLLTICIVSCSANTDKESHYHEFEDHKCSCGKIEDNYFLVTFKSEGGSIVDNQIVEQGDCIEEPEIPVKEGYDFDGWYFEDQVFDFTNEVTCNLILTARWLIEGNSYEIIKGNGNEQKVNVYLRDCNEPFDIAIKLHIDNTICAPGSNGKIEINYINLTNVLLQVKLTFDCPIEVIDFYSNEDLTDKLDLTEELSKRLELSFDETETLVIYWKWRFELDSSDNEDTLIGLNPESLVLLITNECQQKD